jgi:hypothetical protein
MLITKEQQTKLLNKYINELHSMDKCSGFIDGMNAMMEFIGETLSSKSPITKPEPTLTNSQIAFTLREFITVDRKPSTLDNLPLTTEDKLPQNIKDHIYQLPVMEVDDDFDTFEDCFDGNQQIYLLEHEDGRKFFVDTQGYTYARYIGELV